MDLIRQARRQFRGVGRRNPYGLTSGINQPHAHLSHGTASLPHGPSGSTVSLELPDERRYFTQPDHTTSRQEINASAPPQVQTGVCPQRRPTLIQHTAVVRDTQSRTATASAAVIPHHFLDAENTFSEGKGDPPHSSWASHSETPVRVPDTNAPAELSPCNGNSAILGQHEACPDRDDNERTRPVTTPSVRPSRATRELFSPLPTVAGLHDGSLTYMNDEVVLFWQPPSGFSQWTLSPFTVDLVEYSCAEQFMMASKARLFGDDSTLSAIFATDDPREHKRFGRQVRQFDNDTWLHERENIAFRGDLAKFSQNENLRLALLHTGEHRLAEASPYDNIWGIGLRASDHRASSPHTWRGSNLLGHSNTYERLSARAHRRAPAYLCRTSLPLLTRRAILSSRSIRPQELASIQYHHRIPSKHCPLRLPELGARRPHTRGPPD